jgi:hypothetical protein
MQDKLKMGPNSCYLAFSIKKSYDIFHKGSFRSFPADHAKGA